MVTPTRQHGFTTQKSTLDIFIALRTWNLYFEWHIFLKGENSDIKILANHSAITWLSMHQIVVRTKIQANKYIGVNYIHKVNKTSATLTLSKGRRESEHIHVFLFLLSCTNKENINIQIFNYTNYFFHFQFSVLYNMSL